LLLGSMITEYAALPEECILLFGRADDKGCHSTNNGSSSKN